MNLQGHELSRASNEDQLAGRQIEDLTQRILAACTIPEAKRVIAIARSAAVAIRNLHVSEARKREAEAMVVRAERRLGQVMLQIKSRKHPEYSFEDSIGPVKAHVLNEAKVSRGRCLRAEHFARLSDEEFESAIRRAPRVNNHSIAVLTGHGSTVKELARANAIRQRSLYAEDLAKLILLLFNESRPPTIAEADAVRSYMAQLGAKRSA